MTSPSASRPTSGELTALRVIFFGAVLISVVHYLDNWIRFDRYLIRPAGPIRESWEIPVGWLVITAVGVVGYRRFIQERWWPAVVLLAIYSLSGLVSLVHYTLGPPSAFDAFQNTLIVTDVVAGLAILGFAIRTMFRRALPTLAAD